MFDLNNEHSLTLKHTVCKTNRWLNVFQSFYSRDISPIGKGRCSTLLEVRKNSAQVKYPAKHYIEKLAKFCS